MNYHFIKNNFEIVKHQYPDKFDIKIYYLNDHYCYIFTKRLDSTAGWGLNLKIKLFNIRDLNKNESLSLLNEKLVEGNIDNYFEILEVGPSDYNTNISLLETKISLEINNTIPTIPSIIHPRKYKLIENKYKLFNLNSDSDIHIVIYKIELNKIKIIIRRLDNENGWDDNLRIELYDNNIKNRKELINIGSSSNNYKFLILNTKIDVYEKSEYKQNIPFNIIQTGNNNKFKNILHFNSIMTFIELNPEYTYIYYNDIDGRKFLRDNFSEDINYAYDIVVPGAFKGDILRYCLLYNMGGCYFDCKQILRTSIKSFLDSNKTLILCNDVIDNALLNAILCSTPNNTILDKVIKDCSYNVIHKLGKSPLDITGPIFLYKSIKKFINVDNLILQNNRPPDNFQDFTNDYFNNNITLINSGKLIINRFYKGYYENYLNTVHYGKLFNNNETYYKNVQNIDKIKIYIYPNKNNDKFLFSFKNKNILIVKRVDSKDGWNFNLKILIILPNYEELFMEIGSSVHNKKEITIDIF
jgi:mannosyltransferase OCH1-like enzyme